MYNVIKRTFSYGVVAATILWSVGVAALIPTVAQGAVCPTLAAGDMIKVSGKAAIYAIRSDLKVLYFPSGDEFKSWRPTYGGYISITQECFDSLSVPSNYPGAVNYHPGSYLIKRPSSDQLYVVEPNNTKATITEALAQTLYGTSAFVDGVGAKVMTVSDVFWPHYINNGPAITEAKVHPGLLFKLQGQPSTIWLLDADSKLREVTASGFTANGFQERFVRVVPTSAVEGFLTGDAITSAIPAITDKTQSGGITTTPIAQGNLTVALAATTPAAMSVPKNGTRVPFTTVVLSAGSSNAINVDAITVKRTGLSNYTVFAGTTGKVWMEKDGARVSSQSSMNSSDEVNLTFSPILNIPAGTSVTLEIVASLNDGAGNAALGIASASAVSAGGVTVGGSYPVMGNLMSFADYNVATASIEITTATKTPKVGDTQIELTRFTLAQTATSSKDVIFKSITLRNNGTEDMSKVLSNVYLERAGTPVSGNGVIDGRYITFTLNAGGLEIEKGDSWAFIVKGDIMAKDNTSNPSLRYILNKVEDVSVIEKSTGFGSAITNLGGTGDVHIDAGALSLTKKSTQPADATVTKGATGVVSLLANIRADEAIKADGIRLGWDGASVTSSFQNAKVYLNGYLLGSFDPTTDTNVGTYEIETSVTFNKGDNELKVTIDAKTASDVVSGANIKFKVVGAEFVNGENPEYVASGNSVSASDVNGSPIGAIITIEGSALTVSRNDGFTDGRKVVQGTTDVVLGKFNVKATGDKVTITSIDVGGNEGTGTKVADTSVYDAKIYVDGSQVGTTRNFSSGATFSGLNVVVLKDQIRSFEVRMSFDTASTGTIKVPLTFNGQDGQGRLLSVMPKIYTVQNEVIANGTLTAAIGSDTPDSGIILAKEAVEYNVAEFRLSSQHDISNITEMSFTNSSTHPSDARISAVKLYKGTTLLGTDFLMNNTTTVKISTNALIVPANGNEIVTVKVVLNPITESAQSTSTFRAELTQVKFKGSAGSEVTQAVTSSNIGNLMEIRKTRPIFAGISLGSTGSQSTQEDVLKFTITADVNEDVLISTLNFVRVGSASSTPTDFKLFEGTTERATSTNAQFSGLTIEIAKGTTKTFTVRANTAAVDVDKTFGLTLEKGASNTNILWAEYFIDLAPTGKTGNAEYLYTLPISNTKKY
jgi:hypothetical protein